MATGPLWNTRLALSWTDRGTAADGVDYENNGVHLLRLRWGRLVELTASLDTQHLEHTLNQMAHAGIEEAAADPIADVPTDAPESSSVRPVGGS